MHLLKNKQTSLTPTIPLGLKLDMKSCKIESEKTSISTEISTPFALKSDYSSYDSDLTSQFSSTKSNKLLFKVEKTVVEEKSLRKELREIKEQNFMK